jgi:hypothetical protein
MNEDNRKAVCRPMMIICHKLNNMKTQFSVALFKIRLSTMLLIIQQQKS